MRYLPGGNVDGNTPSARQPLPLRQVGLATRQFGCPVGNLRLELGSGFAKLLFCSSALVDEAGALECGAGLIRCEGQQQVVRRGWKIAALGGGGDEAAFATAADRDGDAAAGSRPVANVGDELFAGEASVPGELTLQPFWKLPPRDPADDVDCLSVTAGIPQAHE